MYFLKCTRHAFHISRKMIHVPVISIFNIHDSYLFFKTTLITMETKDVKKITLTNYWNKRSSERNSKNDGNKRCSRESWKIELNQEVINIFLYWRQYLKQTTVVNLLLVKTQHLIIIISLMMLFMMAFVYLSLFIKGLPKICIVDSWISMFVLK